MNSPEQFDLPPATSKSSSLRWGPDPKTSYFWLNWKSGHEKPYTRYKNNRVFMKYKRLGRSGLKVSQLCLGSNNFGGQLDEETSVRIMRRAVDLGINLIDTANVYVNGKSEEVIGKAVHDYRNDVIIATKVGAKVWEKTNENGLSRKHILWQIEQSLKRLRTDFIDIYYLHFFDEETPLEETLSTMNDLVREGRVRYIACANFAAWQISESHRICEKLDLENFVAAQPRYNLLQREIETDLLSYCRRGGLGVLTYSPLMGGFLTGKYLKNVAPPAESRGSKNQRYWERVNKQQNFEKLEQIKEVAHNAGIPLYQLAVAWILANPLVTAPIVGASTPEQVEANCHITEINLSNERFSELDKITKSDHVPYWRTVQGESGIRVKS